MTTLLIAWPIASALFGIAWYRLQRETDGRRM